MRSLLRLAAGWIVALGWVGTASALPVIETGLVAAWELNGDAYDLSGHGHHGSVVGAVPAVDRFGNADGAYSFAPLAARIELPLVFSSHVP